MSDRRAYDFAFRVGVLGTVLLSLYTILGNTLAALSVLALWNLAILFVLPWVYLIYEDKIGNVPHWLIRGPHQ